MTGKDIGKIAYRRISLAEIGQRGGWQTALFSLGLIQGKARS